MNITLDDFNWDEYESVREATIRINGDDIGKELSTQAYKYTFYHGMLITAKRGLDRANHDLEVYSSQIRKVEQERRAEASLKTTEKILDAFVLSDVHCQDLRNKVIDLTYKVGLMKGLVSALEQRHDMLIQLSSTKRAEMNLYNKN